MKSTTELPPIGKTLLIAIQEIEEAAGVRQYILGLVIGPSKAAEGAATAVYVCTALEIQQQAAGQGP